MKNGQPNGSGGNGANDQIDDRWNDKYPHLGTESIPIEPYISKEYFELERERIFRNVWLNVGRVEQIPHLGDYFVEDLPVCHTSIVVVRGKDGQIHAFHNMCSHRGNKVVWDRSGSCQNFTCKFHGWSYGFDGKLKFVPDEESFFGLQKGKLGLTPVSVDVWAGFIFVHLDPNPTETLNEYLAEVVPSLEGYPFPEVSATRFCWRTEIKANWKIAQDAFQEGYHFPVRHKESAAAAFTSETNPYCHFLSVDIYDRHRRTSSYGNLNYRPTTVEGMAYQFGSSVVVDRGLSMDDLPVGVNPTRRQDWSIDVFWIFPNFSVFPTNGTYLTHHFWPITEDRTIWETNTYFPKAQNAGQRFSQEYSKVLLRDILMEDGTTLEHMQDVLASGAKTQMQLQHQEICVRHAYKVGEDYVGFYSGRANSNG